jgi:hypothetical protein
MTVTYDIIWENKRPVLRAIHIHNPRLSNLSQQIRDLSSKKIKDKLLRLELGQVELTGMNETARLAILNNPQMDPVLAIAKECKNNIQSARNRLMSIRRELK